MFAINRAGRSQHHPPHLCVAHGFHQGDGAAHVHVVVIAREKLGFGHRDPRCEVIDAVHILQKRPEQRFIVDIPLGEFNFREQAGGVPSGGVVQDAHIMPLTGEAVAERRPEKASPSGN